VEGVGEGKRRVKKRRHNLGKNKLTSPGIMEGVVGGHRRGTSKREERKKEMGPD